MCGDTDSLLIAGSATNVAVTLLSALSVTVQVLEVVAQAPLQPLNRDWPAGAAVSVTWVPFANAAEQLDPQSIPAGALVTVPPPLPARTTVRVSGGAGERVNVAVTVVSEPSVSWQVPVPEQPPPDQSVNVEPAAGVAVSVTTVPSLNDAEQLEPQSIPEGELVTDPEPVPDVEIASLWVIVVNAAVTDSAALIVT
jgi:hypothetical protein